jgi:hypothetical protein
MFKSPVESTYYGDPIATHRVVTGDIDLGYGIFGYYSEFDAYRVRAAILKAGKRATVEIHDSSNREAGMHPMVRAHLGGFV